MRMTAEDNSESASKEERCYGPSKGRDEQPANANKYRWTNCAQKASLERLIALRLPERPLTKSPEGSSMEL